MTKVDDTTYTYIFTAADTSAQFSVQEVSGNWATRWCGNDAEGAESDPATTAIAPGGELKPMVYSKEKNPVKHYGSLVFQLFERLKTMPAGKERDALTKLTANQMKRNLIQWSHGSNDDEKIISDLARFTDGIIQLDLDKFKFDVSVAKEPVDKKKKKR